MRPALRDPRDRWPADSSELEHSALATLRRFFPSLDEERARVIAGGMGGEPRTVDALAAAVVRGAPDLLAVHMAEHARDTEGDYFDR